MIKEDQYVELTTRTFDVLQFLIERAGSVVTKDELLGNVWNGNFVEESNLPVHISKLRRSLGESKYNRFIETVQGTGYRFVAPVREVTSDEWEHTGASKNEFLYSQASLLTSNMPALAVLPLHDETGANEYLVDGITESLINRFSLVPGLKVIARNTVFQYRTEDLNYQEIGRALGVSSVLTGYVRLVDERLVIGMELISAKDGILIWGNQYERAFSEIVNVQQDIVSAISKALMKAAFRNVSSNSTPTENAESYTHYLLGKYLLAKGTAPEIHKAIVHFRKSVSCSPTNIHSLIAIVEAYYSLHVLERISRAEILHLIEPSLEILAGLRQSVDVVQLLYGKLKLFLDWKSEAAEKHVRASLALNPNLLNAHSLYAEIMTISGRTRDAIAHANQILALDPVSLSSFKSVARIFYKLGRYEDSILHLNFAREMEPTDFETLLLLGAATAELGEYKKALVYLRDSYSAHQAIETLSMIGYVEALSGRKQGASRMVERIRRELEDHNGHAINFARIYLAMGEKDKAYLYLEQAFDQHAMDLYGLSLDPRWKSIRNEQRFKILARRVSDCGDDVKLPLKA